MSKTQIEVGAVVRTEVGGKQVNVRIEREVWKGDKHTGWGGINLSTNRPATIKADAKMKRVEEPVEPPAAAPAKPKAPASPKGGKGKKGTKAAAPETAATDANVAAHVAPEREGLPAATTPAEAATGALFNAGGEPGVEGQVPPDAKGKRKNAAPDNNKKNRRLPKSEPAKPKRLGVLGAAALILGEATEPMGANAVVEAMLAQKLWFTSGKTPAATLYAAMIREIRDKGKESRFIKTGRGLFALRAGAKGAL